MAEFGLLPEGVVIPTVAELRAEIEEDIRSNFGRSIPMGDFTLLGHLIAILCERLRLLYEIAVMSFDSIDADKAQGVMLEVLALLTATFRLAAGGSVATVTMCGDDGTIFPVDSMVSTASTGKDFDVMFSVTLELLDDWVAATPYAKGDRVTNSARCYECTTAGVSAGGGGPVTTADDIVDNTVHWTYLGEGDSAADATVVSVEKTSVVATSRDLTVIKTPVSGVNTCINLLDAKLGHDRATDQDLRLLREAELAKPGTGTPPAVRAALLALDGVKNATVFFNNTELVDDDGLPPKSTECLVLGGDDQDIWDCLWQNVPLGIETIGDQVGTVVDDEGVEQTLRFSRAEEIQIYSRVVLSKNPKTYDGDDTVESAITAFGAAAKTGDDAVASAISAQAFRVSGVIDVEDVQVYTDAIATPVAWAALTPYVATPGARSVVTNGARVYICTTGGNSAGAGGPTGIGADIVDGTVHWRYIGIGSRISVTKRQLTTYDTSRLEVVSADGEP